MWDLFDQWIVLAALFWAVFVIYRKLTKKSFLSCETPCSKKIFKEKTEVISLKRKVRL